MKKKAMISVIFLIIALSGGTYLLLQDGKDQTVVAKTEKRSSLASETVNAAFLQVGGKVQAVYAKEGDIVEEGQELVQLDTTDIDLQMRQLEVTIGKLDIQMNQIAATMANTEKKVHLTQQKAQVGVDSAKVSAEAVKNSVKPEDIAQQKIAIASAQEATVVATNNIENAQTAVNTATDNYELVKTGFERVQALYESGLTTKAELEQAQAKLDGATAQLDLAKNQEAGARSQLTIAQNTVQQQETALQKLENGASAEDHQKAALAIEQATLALGDAQLALNDAQLQNYSVELLVKEKENLALQLENLQNTKAKMTLKAPVSGTVKTVVPAVGENVAAGGVAAVLETNELYYEFYVTEEQIVAFTEGQKVDTYIVPLKETLNGRVALISSAPKFASMRMVGDTGGDEISSFLVKVVLEKVEPLLPGMTVEVKIDEAAH